MPKYHISPITGRANICKATIKCPPAPEGQHFSDKAQANAMIEVIEKERYENLEKLRERYPNAKDASGIISRDELHGLALERMLRQGAIKESTWNSSWNAWDSIEHTPFNMTWGSTVMEVTLSPDDYETEQAFLKGYCSVLAYEMHLQTGLPFVINAKNSRVPDAWLGHVGIMVNDREYVDVSGVHNIGGFSKEYGGYFTSDDVKVVGEKEFLEILPKQDAFHRKFDRFERGLVAHYVQYILKEWEV